MIDMMKWGLVRAEAGFTIGIIYQLVSDNDAYDKPALVSEYDPFLSVNGNKDRAFTGVQPLKFS